MNCLKIHIDASRVLGAEIIYRNPVNGSEINAGSARSYYSNRASHPNTRWVEFNFLPGEYINSINVRNGGDCIN
jgi:hypothetical protein